MKEAVRQDEVFAGGEGDAWFNRNAHVLGARVDQDAMLRLLRYYEIQPSRALEVGACNGYRMQALAEATGAECHALDASSEAVEDGKRRHPLISIRQGLGSSLPYEGEGFDLVIVCAVLHWVDRTELLKTVAEIDRVLKNGGFLAIGDFHPDRPERIRYHHRTDRELFTYKQNYPALFLASGIYSLLATEILDHDGMKPRGAVAPHDRFGVTLLRKDLTGIYLEKAKPGAI